MTREIGITAKKSTSAKTPEGKVKALLKDGLSTSPRIWFFMPVSTGLGRKGIPDFIACFDGFFIAMEAKSDIGKATALQKKELMNIYNARGATFIVSGEKQAQDITNRIKERIKDDRPISSYNELLSTIDPCGLC